MIQVHLSFLAAKLRLRLFLAAEHINLLHWWGGFRRELP